MKSRTAIKFNATKGYLIEHFGAGRDLRNINSGHANDWRPFLIGKGIGENTIRNHTQIARQFFHAAARRQLIEVNPFLGLKAATQANPERFHFVSREDAKKVLEACPDANWRLIFALSRFGSLRCPSETLALTCGTTSIGRTIGFAFRASKPSTSPASRFGGFRSSLN